jgi:hypothetical protein
MQCHDRRQDRADFLHGQRTGMLGAILQVAADHSEFSVL